jgi:transposase
MILEQTTQHMFLIHDGARYPTSQATTQFLEAHCQRSTVHPLPSYSPDDNPIAYLWKKTKQRATHNPYCKEFVQLTVSVDNAMAYFATHPDTVFGLFGHYCEESGLELKYRSDHLTCLYRPQNPRYSLKVTMCQDNVLI